MPTGLERRYGQRHLHFITCSCYRRIQLLRSVRARNMFVGILGEVRAQYHFALVGLVVMPEHFHLLMNEPRICTPSKVMQILKQRVSRSLRQKCCKRTSSANLRLWRESPNEGLRSFWQSRFYDFNVWSRKKRIEKLHYMHMNPVERGLVAHPKDWPWSSYASYQRHPDALIQVDFVD